MRGYFGIGVERLSKPLNLGNLMRSANAFGAGFFFTINADVAIREMRSDTSRAAARLPYYSWNSVEEISLPDGCVLVGIELLDEAIELPTFRHPLQAAYVLGPERGSLSEPLLRRCGYLVRIPTAFCINVAMAGAIVMYDRVRTLGRFAPRPVRTGAPTETLPSHRHGSPINRCP